MDLICVPSAFTETRGARTGSRCCAPARIENLAWVLAPAQGGTHANGRQTHGP